MFQYKTLPSNQRPLALEIDSETFVSEWKACWENPDRNMDKLIELARPAIEKWEQLLRRTAQPDVNMVSLCRRLGDPERALKRIDAWIEWCDSNHSVEAQLWYLFIKSLKAMKYYPHQAKPIMAEYVIARGFKDKISDDIKRSLSKKIDVRVYDPTLYEVPVTPIYPDYLLLKNLNLNKWEAYLFWWIENRRSPREVARVTHIPFDTFKKEERHIWHSVKEKFYKEE